MRSVASFERRACSVENAVRLFVGHLWGFRSSEKSGRMQAGHGTLRTHWYRPEVRRVDSHRLYQ